MIRALLAVTLAACTSQAAIPTDPSQACLGEEVVARRCLQCHGAEPAAGARISLASGDDRARHERAIRARIDDPDRPMPPSGPLPADERALLRAALAGGDRCPTPAAPREDRLRCTPDLFVRPARPISLGTDGLDEYVCFGVEVTATSKRHVIGIAPRIDARAVVHHVTLLLADAPVDPTPARCPLGGSTTWRSVYGWAPGTGVFELPSEAGFPIGPNAHLVVQVHYANGRGERDASGFDLCTTADLRPNDADIMAFGTQSFSIPAKGALDLDCKVQVPAWGATTHLFAAFPHMHRLGRSIATTVTTPAGGTNDLGSRARWSFDDQTWTRVDHVLRPGDLVTTRCAWQNPTDRPVTFGERTDDEMCYAFVMYWPRIEEPSWHWSLPALSSTCTAR